MSLVRLRQFSRPVALLVAAILLTGMGTGLAQAATKASPLAIPVTGIFSDAGGTGKFAGTFTLQRFAVQNNQIVAVGIVTGTLTNSAGTVLGSVVQTVTTAVDPTAIQASCPILHLELGPLDLNLLGLVVHLNRIVLDITAVPGAGNLLGNLLCAIANLLNGGSLSGLLQQIVDLLNQILAALGG